MLQTPPSPAGTTPQTPASALLSTHIRNESADADTSAQRKRPRLDSGDRAYRSMSADHSGSPSVSDALDHNLRISRALTPSQNSLQVDGTTSDEYEQNITARTTGSPPVSPIGSSSLLLTPSKMTINIRDHGALDSPPGPQVQPPQLIGLGADTTSSVEPLQNEASASVVTCELTTVSLERYNVSSTIGSPEIEVAELEDITEHARPTVWTKAPRRDNPIDLNHSLMRELPRLRGDAPPDSLLEELAMYLRRNSAAAESTMVALSRWMLKYATATADLQPAWYELFTMERDFWEKIPALYHAGLSHATFTSRPAHEADEAGSHPVTEFLSAFTTMAARVIHTDLQTLEDNRDDVNISPDLLSQTYIEVFTTMLRLPLNHRFYAALSHDGHDAALAAEELPKNLVSKLPDNFNTLIKTSMLLLERAAQSCEQLAAILVLVKHYVAHSLREYANRPLDEDAVIAVGADAKRFFQMMYDQVQRMIKKQNSSLNIEGLKVLVHELSEIMRLTIRNSATSFSDLVPREFEARFATLDLDDRVLFIESAWKMEIYTTCIIHGRMDARVGGVDKMQDLLVAMYQRYIRQESINSEQPTSPMIEFLSDFIRKQKLVSYLTGVDSHPQLISRSSNIVGFLIVSQTFTNEDFDIIWDAMVSCQDSRVADAIIQLMKGFLAYATLTHFTYLFQKFFTVPATRFDIRMQDLCRWLTASLLSATLREAKITQNRSEVYSLFLRTMRQSFTEHQLALSMKQELYRFSTTQLQELTRSLPLPEKEWMDIVSDCIRDVASNSDRASGSISALAVILGITNDGNGEVNWSQLQTRWKLLDLLIENLSHLAETVSETNGTLQQFAYVLRDRMNCICMFAKNLPSAFTPELTSQAWSTFVGSQAQDGYWRDVAWQFLTDVAASCTLSTNGFLNSVLMKHFGILDGRQLAPGVLPFAERVSQYYEHVEKPTARACRSAPRFSIHDIYWTIALKTSDNRVAMDAIDHLVRHQFHRDSTITNLENLSDAEFVKKGMAHLMDSAMQLKRQEDSLKMELNNQPELAFNNQHVFATTIRFSRIIAILMRFQDFSLRNFLPGQGSSSPSIPETPGETVEISYEAIAAGITSRKLLKIGDMATLHQLHEIFCSQMEVSKVKILSNGRAIDSVSRGNTLVQDNPALTAGHVQVIDISGMTAPISQGGTSSKLLEMEIMRHFIDLYELLCYEGSLGLEVYKFLTNFDPHVTILSQLHDSEVSFSQVFPSDAKYKSMYSAYALRSMLNEQLEVGKLQMELLSRGISLLKDAIISLDTVQLDPVAAVLLVETMLRYLRADDERTGLQQEFDISMQLVQPLGRLAGAALVTDDDPNSVGLTEAAFATILELLAREKRLLFDSTTKAMVSSLLQLLLLDTNQEHIHETTKNTIQRILSRVITKDNSKASDFLHFFWSMLCPLLSKALESESSTESLFSLTSEIFRHLPNSLLKQLPLPDYAVRWSNILCGCETPKYLDISPSDWTIFGISELICLCIRAAELNGGTIILDDSVLRHVWHSLLFPRMLDTSQPNTKERLPVLNPEVRRRLYNVILAMLGGNTAMGLAIDLCHNLSIADNNSNAWAWGYAQVSNNQATGYNSNWQIELPGLLRHIGAYPGLKNLSNTCYLNSLLSQLFMNINFRSFMLSLPLYDPHDKQRLLWETQRLFGFQQESWLHAIDTESFTDTVITYDGTPVDVTIQMDVDEFYNLLFDRWESQMNGADTKLAFKRFYGGQIVQQIKSKDCDHISERIEPFSAVQCEIQGKQNLYQSLNAYVEGEVMEGENKYSCTACGKYVNAVKRACFRDVPENLILHLKRFDFDLTSGIRSKINDYFEFPVEIDMGCYNVEYLKDTTKPHVPDMFVLVGILVHSGQAEAGHYYSFIRDISRDPETWFEFNDSEVEPFNPADIGSHCFGGYQEPVYQANVLKNFNAYMLFYTRKSAVDSVKKQISKSQLPAANIPEIIAKEIAFDNSSFMRKYCMADEEYGNFLKTLLSRYRKTVEENSCSEDHDLQVKVIQTALLQTHQILGRRPPSDAAANALSVVSHMSSKCIKCAKLTLDSLISAHSITKDIFLRCQQIATREELARLIESTLRQIRQRSSSCYGLFTPSSSQESLHESVDNKDGAFKAMAQTLLEIIPDLGYSKYGWTSYYHLLNQLALYGDPERSVLHSMGYLNYSLRYLAISHTRQLAKQWRGYQQFARACEKFEFPLAQLIEFTSTMLRFANSDRSHAVGDKNHSNDSGSSSTLTKDEWNILSQNLRLPEKSYPLVVLLAVFLPTVSHPNLCEDFVKALCSSASLHESIVDTFKFGLEDELGPELGSLLAGTATFLETCPIEQYVMELVAVASKEAQWTEANSWAGPDFLRFFTRIHRVQVRGDLVQGGTTDPLLFKRALLMYAPRFTPSLLSCDEKSVREGTLDLLQKLIFDHHGAENNDEYSDELEKAAARIFRSCGQWIENHHRRGNVFVTLRLHELRQAVLAYIDRFGCDPELQAEDQQHLSDTFIGALESLDKISTSSPEPLSSGELDSQECSDGSNVD